MAVISCFLQGFRFFGASVIYLFFCPSVKMATRSGPTATLAPQVSLSLLHISAVVRMDGLGPAYGPYGPVDRQRRPSLRPILYVSP